jgi:hypothetical protein
MERFRPDVERTRWRAGWLFLGLGGLAVAALLWRVATAGRVTVTSLVVLALAAGLVVWGMRLAFASEAVFEVDVDKRTYVLIRDGRRAAAGALEELGPLVASVRTRTVGLDSQARTVTEYVVKPHAHSKLDLFVAATPAKARRQMEGLARRWRLPCQSIGGEVRAAEDLDKPLHERLRGSAQATEPVPLRPEWGVRVDELTPGYALVSTNRSWAPLSGGWTIFMSFLGAVGLGSIKALPSTVREMAADELGKVLLGLAGLLLVVVLFQVGRALRDALSPGTVRVTPGGVSYRGRRLAFADIEEITTGKAVEIVADRRKLRLATSFCPAEATGAVARELQRMILAVAPAAPRAV